MKYNVIVFGTFEKQYKRLAKKYPSLKSEVIQLINDLKTEPKKGIPLGRDCYKIRLAIASKGKGKSGGARVITYFAITENEISLLYIYDKSEQSDIDDKELQKFLNQIK